MLWTRGAESITLDCERLLVGNSAIGLPDKYGESLCVLGGGGAIRAGIKLAIVDAPGGRGAGRAGTRAACPAEGGLDKKVLGPGTVRGIGGGVLGFSKLVP